MCPTQAFSLSHSQENHLVVTAAMAVLVALAFAFLAQPLGAEASPTLSLFHRSGALVARRSKASVRDPVETCNDQAGCMDIVVTEHCAPCPEDECSLLEVVAPCHLKVCTAVRTSRSACAKKGDTISRMCFGSNSSCTERYPTNKHVAVAEHCCYNIYIYIISSGR